MNTLILSDFLPSRSFQGQMREETPDPELRDIRGEICETFSIAPHLVETTLSTLLEEMWWSAIHDGYTLKNMFLCFAYPFTTYVPTNVTVVRARCGLQAVESMDDVYQFKFPALPEYNFFDWTYWTWEGSLGGSSKNVSHNLSRWVTLADGHPPPEDPEQDPPSAAVLVSLDSYSTLNDLSTIYVLPCSMDARWAEGVNIREVPLAGPQPHHASAFHARPAPGCVNPFAPSPDGSWKRITPNQSFLDWLTPTLDGGPSSNQELKRTTLADILEFTAETGAGQTYTDLSDNSARPAEMIMAHLFAEGLSRMGLWTNQDLWGSLGNPDTLSREAHSAMFNNKTVFIEPTEIFDEYVKSRWELRNTGKQFTYFEHEKHKTNVDVLGYALKSHSITDYLALAVLCAHIAIALTHTAWIIRSRRTSYSWDGAEELLALAWNSEPSRGAPKNTCAGINDRRTLSTRVQIRVVEPTPGAGTETLQLVATNNTQSVGNVRTGTAYGSR